MKWSHNGIYFISGDHKGMVHYYRKNMRSLVEKVMHEEAIRGLRCDAEGLAVVCPPSCVCMCVCACVLGVSASDF
jgi:hypothetical protein